MAITIFPHPNLYAGDLNCQHVNRVYSPTSPGCESLASWAAANNLLLLCTPKEIASFISHRWKVGTNSDLAFTSVIDDNQLLDRHVLGKVLLSQHQPSFKMTPRLEMSTYCNPVTRWNFHKAVWNYFYLPIRDSVETLEVCHLHTQQTLRRHIRHYARACSLRLNNGSNMAIIWTMCQRRMESQFCDSTSDLTPKHFAPHPFLLCKSWKYSSLTLQNC